MVAASLGASTWAQTNNTDTVIGGDGLSQAPPTLPPPPGTITQVQIMNEQTPVAIVDDTVPLDKSVVMFQIHSGSVHCPDVADTPLLEIREHWTQTRQDAQLYTHHFFFGDDVADIQHGVFKANNQREMYMLYDVEPNADGTTFAGRGVIYQEHVAVHGRVCTTGFGADGLSHEAVDFAVTLSGACDGSLLALNSTDNTGYNVTTTNYHVMCIP